MKCIGLTKPYHRLHRCQNQCKSLFCRHHWIQPFVLIFTLGNIFLWATGIYNNIFSSISSQKETLNSFIDWQKQSQLDLERKFEHFAIPELNSNTKDPGFGIVLIIKFLPQSQFRRKYIMDLGETIDKNRISLYLDPNDILTYELIDSVGSIYNTKIPNSEYQFNKFMILYCEYGFSSNFSYFRIFVNGHLITQNKYISQILTRIKSFSH